MHLASRSRVVALEARGTIISDAKFSMENGRIIVVDRLILTDPSLPVEAVAVSRCELLPTSYFVIPYFFPCSP